MTTNQPTYEQQVEFINQLAEMVEHLRELNLEYEKTVKARRAIPMSERRFKTPKLQREADVLCRCIMQMERAIITKLLEGK